MNQFRLAIPFLSLAFALTSASASASAQSMQEKSKRVVKYSIEVVNSRRIMEGLIDRNQQHSDSTKQKMKSVVAHISFDDLASRLSDSYQKHITEIEIDQCIHFIDSPLGQNLNTAVQTSEFTRDPGTFFNALNISEQEAINKYMSGSCLFVNLPNRRELQDVFSTYLSEQVCSHLRQTDTDTYAKLEEERHCPR